MSSTLLWAIFFHLFYARWPTLVMCFQSGNSIKYFQHLNSVSLYTSQVQMKGEVYVFIGNGYIHNFIYFLFNIITMKIRDIKINLVIRIGFSIWSPNFKIFHFLNFSCYFKFLLVVFGIVCLIILSKLYEQFCVRSW
jgi:hypothetical protein